MTPGPICGQYRVPIRFIGFPPLRYARRMNHDGLARRVGRDGCIIRGCMRLWLLPASTRRVTEDSRLLRNAERIGQPRVNACRCHLACLRLSSPSVVSHL